MNYVGDFAVGQTVFIWFNTFDSNDPSASVTVTDLTDTDTVIYRDDSLTQRANTAGMTIDIDVDTFAGVHKLTIDTADNTVPDFYEAGHDYSVVAVGATVDGATGGINAVIGTFSIANRRQAGEMCRSAITTLASQTSFTLDTGTASAQNDAYNNCTIIVTDQTTRIQKAVGYISDYTGATRTVTLRDAPLATGYTMAVADSVEIFANSAFANVDSIKATDQTANDNGADINAILLDTAEIGTAGAGLTNLGASGNDWNTVVPDAAGVAPTAAEIETEIWDALQSAHVVPASMGIIASEIATIDGKVDTAQLDLDTITGTAGVLIGTDAANVTEISDAVWDEDATGHQTQGTFGQAIGDPAADATTIYQAVATDATGDNVAIDVVAVKAETALIVADTNELQTDNVPGLIATAQADLDVITGATGVNLLNATQASIDAIEVDTGTTLDAALAVVDANVDTMVAGLVTGAFEGTPTTTVMQTNLAEATDNHYNGAVLIITSGNGLDQRTDITDYTGATGTLTVTAVATAPVATDTFKIV